MKNYMLGIIIAGIMFPSLTMAAPLTQSQVDAIIAVLSSFGVDQATVDSVRLDLEPAATTTPSTPDIVLAPTLPPPVVSSSPAPAESAPLITPSSPAPMPKLTVSITGIPDSISASNVNEILGTIEVKNDTDTNFTLGAAAFQPVRGDSDQQNYDRMAAAQPVIDATRADIASKLGVSITNSTVPNMPTDLDFLQITSQQQDLITRSISLGNGQSATIQVRLLKLAGAAGSFDLTVGDTTKTIQVVAPAQ